MPPEKVGSWSSQNLGLTLAHAGGRSCSNRGEMAEVGRFHRLVLAATGSGSPDRPLHVTAHPRSEKRGC